MTDTGARRAQTADFVVVKVNTVCQPCPVTQPANAFQIIDCTQTKHFQAKLFFIQRFRQMRMQPDIFPLRQSGALTHNFGGDRKRRARCQCNLHPRALAALMIAVNQALAVLQNHLARLDRLFRRQTALLLAETHRAARQ